MILAFKLVKKLFLNHFYDHFKHVGNYSLIIYIFEA